MSPRPDSTLDHLQRTVVDLRQELERTRAERDEALEQQTATAEVLQVINASPGDLAPVFDAILEKAMHLCGAAFGELRARDGDSFRSAATRGVPAAFADYRRNNEVVAEPGSLGARIADGELVIHVLDLKDADVYRSGYANRRALVDLGGARTALVAALRQDATPLGFIILYRQEVRPFTDKQIALLQNFAVQAVIAMENARLLTETREALEQQTATAEVLGVINSSPGDLTPVFDAMLEKATTLCEAVFGQVLVYDGETYQVVALRGVPEFAATMRGIGPFRPPSGSALGRLAEGSRFVHISDITADAAYGSAGDATARVLREVGKCRTLLTVGLHRDDELIGAISVYRQEVRRFSDKQIALLQNFAAQAVIAMENARLITETRDALEQQTATAEVLGVINSSPGDLAPVFDAIVEKAMQLCEAGFGELRVYDGESFRTAATRGVPAAYAEYRRLHDLSGNPGGITARLLGGEQVVHILDLKDKEVYLSRTGHNRRALVDLGGARTALLVALNKGTTIVGAIMIYRQEVRAFTDKQIALLQNFAAQAVIAMENARLLGELRQRTEEVADLNRGLEARVAEQVDELSRVGRLKRFLAPQLAELIVSQGDENILEAHRREIVVVFCDLRGYTAFTETAEPEEVLDFLREYHGALGPLVAEYEGTLDQFSGDGIMVFFNDPVPIPDPAERAVRMAIAMRDAAASLVATWRRRDRDLGFGAGIAQGYATLGQIGFAERSGYTAIGTVCNLAARLCAEAKDGQILISGRVAAAVETAVPLEDLGSLALKGLSQPVSAFNVPRAASQPALRIIEGRP